MTGLTRVGGTQWFVAAALAAGTVAAPNLQAQEAELPVDTAAMRDRPFIVSLGLRLEFVGLASPGASLQMTLIPGRLWFSLEFLAQMIRWNVQYDPHTRRDHLYLGRLVAGVGKGEGLSVFVFHERGAGVIRTHPESWRGRTYDLSGIGLGAGYTVGRVTTAFDLSLGGENRSSGSLYVGLGISLRLGLF